VRNVLLAGTAIAALLSQSVANAQYLPLLNFDSLAAEQRLQMFHWYSKSLHETKVQPDGTKGFALPNPTLQSVGFRDPPPPPYATAREWYTYYEYCARDAIVRATFIESRPALTYDKSLVYTISYFAVTDAIKSDVAFTRGEGIVVYRVGGELEDVGEKLKIDTPDSTVFEPGKSYILRLQRDKTARVRQYYIPQGQTIVVTNDKVYPIRGRYAFLSGTEAYPPELFYSDIKNTFSAVHALKSCPDPR
jgi:hypothetical protein